MKTILDDVRSWFIETVAFDGDLRVVLVEGIRDSSPESLVVDGEYFGPAYRVEPTPQSRRFRVTFVAPLAHQIVDESLSIPYDDEAHDGGVLRIYSRSRWLEHLRHATCILEHPAAQGAAHYQVITEGDIIDVCCKRVPLVQPE